jgi:aminomethyltransferase
MAINTKTTPLNTWHRDHGANMADFGGYDMPLWYSSVKEEHLAVLTGAGVFDTTHMAAVTVIGSGAAGLLQQCFTNDLDACMGPSRHPLLPGRCVYGAFLDDKGRTIDDAIVFFVETDSYMVVVNAGMGGAVAAHLQQHRGAGRHGGRPHRPIGQDGHSGTGGGQSPRPGVGRSQSGIFHHALLLLQGAF